MRTCSVAVLEVRFRLCKAHSRISRCGLSIALFVINKVPIESGCGRVFAQATSSQTTPNRQGEVIHPRRFCPHRVLVVPLLYKPA